MIKERNIIGSVQLITLGKNNVWRNIHCYNKKNISYNNVVTENITEQQKNTNVNVEADIIKSFNNDNYIDIYKTFPIDYTSIIYNKSNYNCYYIGNYKISIPPFFSFNIFKNLKKQL